MIKKYSNFKATAMKILVKINQHNYDNCELLDCRVVGLGGLEPPTSPLSVVRSYPQTLLNKGISYIWEIKSPNSPPQNCVGCGGCVLLIESSYSVAKQGSAIITMGFSR
jgi:hypothetical protein